MRTNRSFFKKKIDLIFLIIKALVDGKHVATELS